MFPCMIRVLYTVVTKKKQINMSKLEEHISDGEKSWDVIQQRKKQPG